MSGWKVVPVPPTKAMVHCANACAEGGSTAMDAGIAAAPEPDWEELAGIVLNDDVYDQYATGGEIRRLAAALRATFGSKP